MLIHAVPLLIAYLFFYLGAAAASRYLKRLSSSRSLCCLPVWWVVHKLFGAAAIVLSIGGVLAMFVGMKWEWKGPKVGGATVGENACRGEGRR